MGELELLVGQGTDRGRVRKHNEDCAEYFIPEDEDQRRVKGAIVLVADGMGGHQAGEVASREAVRRVIREYYTDKTPDVGESLVRAFKSANAALYTLAQADLGKIGMGTTLVVAVILGHKVYVANVGDSRAYLLRRKRFRQITVDHSWVEEQIRAGILDQDQAAKHPHRNLITRALGTRPSVEVDLFKARFRRGDVLLLCTDGLSGQVSEELIARTARSLPPSQAVAELVAEANEQGGLDNVSVAVVHARSERQGVGWRASFDALWKTRPYRQLVVALLFAIFVCLCAWLASLPIAGW